MWKRMKELPVWWSDYIPGNYILSSEPCKATLMGQDPMRIEYLHVLCIGLAWIRLPGI